MGELGWIEGRSIEYVFAYAGGDASRYEPVIAACSLRSPTSCTRISGPWR